MPPPVDRCSSCRRAGHRPRSTACPGTSGSSFLRDHAGAEVHDRVAVFSLLFRSTNRATNTAPGTFPVPRLDAAVEEEAICAGTHRRVGGRLETMQGGREPFRAVILRITGQQRRFPRPARRQSTDTHRARHPRFPHRRAAPEDQRCDNHWPRRADAEYYVLETARRAFVLALEKRVSLGQRRSQRSC